MGRLIKNHWARLIVLTASAYQIGSAIEAFIWPKIFWDVWTKNLDAAVKPVPILQILNLLMGLVGIAWEWPLKYLAGTYPHRSIEFRLILYPLSSILAALIYQGTNAALYYLVGIVVYFWAYSEGEVSSFQSHVTRHLGRPNPRRPPSTKNTDFTDHNGALPPSDDVPVNQVTSFNGVLNKYMHLSQSTSSPQKETKRQQEATITGNTHQSPKRRKATTSSTITPSSVTVPQRITRSKSRSSSSSSTPVSPARSGSGSHTPSSSSSALPRTPERRGRSRGALPQRKQTSSPASLPASSSLLRDTIPENLILLLVGVNPGIMTGTTGFAYAHPSNLFWKLLHWSGITTVRHPPSDTYRLPELYSVGNTNIVERPTRDASMLSKAEMDAGVPILEAKVAAKRPEAVCLVGKSIWESVWRARKGRPIRKEEFRYGWQDEEENMGKCEGWNGTPVFVATTTSGLAAGMSLPEKQAVWNELGKWVVGRREARARAQAQSQAQSRSQTEAPAPLQN
ncbi:uracil-DNA glycosylase-like protein [Aspergillus egyptiacus]|nr:uracil-DNA glycosylase-like protein [Aspergillus egyptiacus]